MAAQEIGFAELQSLVRRSWGLILGLAALCGVAVAVAYALFIPRIYQATARLLISPVAAEDGVSRSADLYALLVVSEGIIERTTAQLAERGVLDPEVTLEVGRDLEALTPGTRSVSGTSASILVLRARNRDPERAAAIANTWAEVFVDGSRPMVRGTAAGSEALIGAQLTPTRGELEELEIELAGVVDEFRAREAETTTGWDHRIYSSKKRGQQAIAAFQTETRRLLQAVVDGSLSESATAQLRSQLLEIVSARAQLAQTPRVRSLEKAASDETLSEMIASGQLADQFDSTLVSQEIDPLYDDLTLRVLGLESDLEQAAASSPADLSAALAELERVQLERAAGLIALLEEKSLELRILRRRRGRALGDLQQEKIRVVKEYGRRVDQLQLFEEKLAKEFNRSAVSRVLEQVEAVRLSSPAVAPTQPQPRQMVVMTAAAAFLGGMLGLMVALFRSGS